MILQTFVNTEYPGLSYSIYLSRLIMKAYPYICCGVTGESRKFSRNLKQFLKLLSIQHCIMVKRRSICFKALSKIKASLKVSVQFYVFRICYCPTLLPKPIFISRLKS
jgi:hypothetical protein